MTKALEEKSHDSHGVSFSSAIPDLYSVLQRRRGYLVLGAVVGMVLGLLYCVIAPKWYESKAQVLVLRKQTQTPIVDADKMERGSSPHAVPQDFIEMHRAVLRSPRIVGQAIERASLADLESFRGTEHLDRAIIKILKVDPEINRRNWTGNNSQVLNISFRAKVPEESSTVINAILDCYQDFLNESSRGPLKDALNLIKQAQDMLKKDLDEKERAYARFRQEAPALWRGPRGSTLYQERLGAIDTQRSALIRDQAELEATLSAVDSARKGPEGLNGALQIISGLDGNTTPLFTRTASRGSDHLERGAATDAYRATLEDELLHLQLEESKLLEQFGDKHPQVLSIRERLHTIQTLLVPAKAAQSGTPTESDHRIAAAVVETKVGQMQQRLVEMKRAHQALDTLFQRELADAKKVFPYETQDDSYRRSIDRHQLLYENILKRMNELDLVSNVGGFDAKVITPPEPGEKVSPLFVLIVPIAFVLGLVGGFGLGFLAELTDKSFRSLDEVRTRLGLPLVGSIPVLHTDEESLRKLESKEYILHPILCSHYRPRSPEAEAYRGVRTALYFSTRGEGDKIIQVTSPEMGDGKSTLAGNLAICIAQSGKQVILIDADLRRPQQHLLFGVSNKLGFSSILNGTAEVPEVIHPTEVPGLSILPSGPIPPNPAELLTSIRLKEMLELVAEQADLVIVDSPPLLAVTDPSVIVPRVDGVLLTLRMGNQNRPQAERAREILVTLGANVLGVVVNGVGDRAQHYYGSYGNNGYYHTEDENAPEATNGKAVAVSDSRS